MVDSPAPPSFRLDGRTALITGASRNVGRAIAVAFADAGADLALVARDPERLSATAASIRLASGVQVTTIAADVSTPVGLDAVVDELRGLPLDILVNNAHTTGRPAPLLEAPDDVWAEVFATNLWAPLRLCRELMPKLRESPTGAVINLVSGSGLQPTPNLGPYGVSKSALWMLTRFLAVECAPDVRVNALCPGLVSEDGEPRNDAHRAIVPTVPMGRVARPEEIAGAAVYLASPAASYTTGELLIVNGGRPW